jgi:hypothetical protein
MKKEASEMAAGSGELLVTKRHKTEGRRQKAEGGE